MAEQETGAKSTIMEFKPCAKVVEETYLAEDGAEIIKYKIGKKHYDKQQIKELGINIEDSYLPEDKIPLMIKKLPDGTYDLSDLTKSTEALGWEHITKTGYFPGSDKNPKANEWDLKLPAPKELFGGKLFYITSTIRPSDTDAAIAGTPDYEYGTISKKRSISSSLTGQLSRSATCPRPLSLQAAMPPQLTQQ